MTKRPQPNLLRRILKTVGQQFDQFGDGRSLLDLENAIERAIRVVQIVALMAVEGVLQQDVYRHVQVRLVPLLTTHLLHSLFFCQSVG